MGGFDAQSSSCSCDTDADADEEEYSAALSGVCHTCSCCVDTVQHSLILFEHSLSTSS